MRRAACRLNAHKAYRPNGQAAPRAPPPDRSRKSAYTEFTLKGRFDTSDVDGAWLKSFMEEYGLTEKDLKIGE